MKYKNFGLIEVIVFLFCVLFLLSMFANVFNRGCTANAITRSSSSIRSIGLTMICYAEDDLRNYKMPYPLPKGKEEIWGSSKNCWSTTVVELLASQKYFRNGNEFQYKAIDKSDHYISMKLNDNSIHRNIYWPPQTSLDMQIYCDSKLTSNETRKMILVASYDNDDIRNCLHDGKGWVVFYADKSSEFIKRRSLKKYSFNSNDPTKISVDLVEGNINESKVKSRKFIPGNEGGPGTFGLGGGSTELMGKTPDDEIYKRLVK